LLTLILIGACKSGSERSFLFSGRRDETIRVEVRNDNFLDATVYAMGGGATVRLGDVTGKGENTLRLNPDRVSIAGGVQLLVDLIGSSSAYLSDAVYVNPGGTMVLQIAPNLRQSYVILR
jgi:hypothetical protein